MRNSIVVENALPGTAAWQLLNPVAGQIEGYASSTSVAPGEQISLHVRSAAPRHRGTVYRLGWYDGLGGREVAVLPEVEAIEQPEPTMDARGMVRCAWEAPYVIDVDFDWVTGLYLVRLETIYDDDSPAEDSYITFVVRDDSRTSQILMEAAVNTYAAYDPWGGKSLYVDLATGSFDTRAYAVSFDRPYADGAGSGQVLQWEVSMARWLERSGYDVSYATSHDLDRQADNFLTSNVIISAGHDEYWTQSMREHAEAARDAGVSLMFLGSNAAYWRVRYEDDGRTVVCYKETGLSSLDPVQDPLAVTRLFRDPVVGLPEQHLIGQMYITWTSGPNFPFRVQNTDSWPFEGTGLSDGDEIPDLVGYEMDMVFPEFGGPDVLTLAESPIIGSDAQPYVSHATLYQQGSSWVFACGTNSWSWGLDDIDLDFLPAAASAKSHDIANDPVQRLTSNILGAMLAPRVVAVDLAGGPQNVVIRYVEQPGDDPTLDGWTKVGDACLVGDFLNKGFDQVLLFNRDPQGGRFMIVSFASGEPPVGVLLSEEWGDSDWLDGWDDSAQLQLSGDFMGLGYDQVLFINRTGGGGRAMVVDFAPGAAGAKIRYYEPRGLNPWLDGIDGDGRLRLVGDFAGIGRDQILFVERDQS
jgi:hypothetical protein